MRRHVRHMVAVRLGLRAGLGGGQELGADELHRRFDLRHLDMLALARCLPMEQRGQDRGGGVEAADRVEIGRPGDRRASRRG